MNNRFKEENKNNNKTDKKENKRATLEKRFVPPKFSFSGIEVL